MSFGCTFVVDQILIRTIDALSFPCTVIAVQPGPSYRVRYLDDGNTEDAVDERELRRAEGEEMREVGMMEAPVERVVRVAPVGDVPAGLSPDFMLGVVDNG